MRRRESVNLEFKAQVTKGFLKTVSAYANYNDGEILFGVDDNGMIIGVERPKEEALRVENMINDTITPVPNFQMGYQEQNNRTILRLEVRQGKDTPYYYLGKAYKRSDTSTVEVDRFELRRLAIEGLNINYEETKASSQNLSFSILESHLREKTGIEKMSVDILKTLNLYHKDAYYTIAGELLADTHDLLFAGIDLIRFGKDINQILYRETIHQRSLLAQYARVVEIFEQYYQYEEISDYTRVKKELIPKAAFREALANAIVHRVWDTNSSIQIGMYEDRIEINSPGGLPRGISEQEYVFGNISVLRNPIIAGVFYRLNLIEKFGTGVARINAEYTRNIVQPTFEVSANYIKITLPIIDTENLDLSAEELLVYQLLKEELELSRTELDQKTGFDKAKTLRILKRLLNLNSIQKLGSGPGVTYRVK